MIALVLLFCAAAGISGCSRELTAPTPAAAPNIPAATLTIRVLARATELPIEGAVVHHDADSWLTDASGELAIPVRLGEEISIDVTAAGYEPMGAAAVLGSNERWTFYLAPAS